MAFGIFFGALGFGSLLMLGILVIFCKINWNKTIIKSRYHRKREREDALREMGR